MTANATAAKEISPRSISLPPVAEPDGVTEEAASPGRGADEAGGVTVS